MKLLNPLLILDIEATGIQTDKAQLLQLAAVFVEDTSIPFAEQKQFLQTVHYNHLDYVEPGALKIISALPLREAVLTADEVATNFNTFVKDLPNKPKIMLAGKNIHVYDLKILKRYGVTFDKAAYRHFDVGSLYFADFFTVPSLNDINKFIGRDSVKHTALADCEDVFEAIRFKMKDKL